MGGAATGTVVAVAVAVATVAVAVGAAGVASIGAGGMAAVVRVAAPAGVDGEVDIADIGSRTGHDGSSKVKAVAGESWMREKWE